LNAPPRFEGAVSSSHCSGVLVIADIVREQTRIVEVSYNLPVPRGMFKTLGPYIAAAIAVAFIGFAYHVVIKVNPTTAALTFLLAVLAVSAQWGLRPAIFMAVLATLVFNYYFLPPIGTFTIADPQNWVALFAFLITAVVASQLSERARREAERANERREETERLYKFSQQLLLDEQVAALLNAIPRYIVECFGVEAAAISLANRADIYRSDSNRQILEAHDLQLVGMRGEPQVDAERQVVIVPLRMGVRVVGSMGVSGVMLSRETLDAMGSLIAIAIERAGAVETLSRAEAARESEQLRSALLDSVTHEFRTPLTAIKASATSLLSTPAMNDAQRTELLTVIDEESDRLNRLVGEAAQMAQLDAQQVELHLGSHQIGEAVEDALEKSKAALGTHPVTVSLPADLPAVRMDTARISEVLGHLIENAAKYSAPQTAIHITGEAKDRAVMVSVADLGPGIDDFEQGLIFEKFYRGRNQRMQVQGTGMGLAISKAIIEAHSGEIGVTSQLGRGSVFYFTLPVE
jgi:two-component system, OmpR family, sensor histidine kinase KdpD